MGHGRRMSAWARRLMRHHPEHHERTAQAVQQLAHMHWAAQDADSNLSSANGVDEATLAARGVVEQMAEDLQQRRAEIGS